MTRLAEQLHPDAENGWSDQDIMKEWIALFGATALDERQWQFLATEVQTTRSGQNDVLVSVKAAVEHVLALALRRRMALPAESSSLDEVLSRVGNAEEAILGVLSALSGASGAASVIDVKWPHQADDTTSEASGETALAEMVHRIRSRPGSPDEFMARHIGCLFRVGGEGLNRQVMTVIRRRSDGWEYARAFDFTGLELSGAQFGGADLFFSRFHRATMNGANFDGATMSLADMAHAVTSIKTEESTPVSFRGAKLDASRWIHSNFAAAHFDGANLRGADLRGVKFSFGHADLGRAVRGKLDYLDEELEGDEPRPRGARSSKRNS